MQLKTRYHEELEKHKSEKKKQSNNQKSDLKADLSTYEEIIHKQDAKIAILEENLLRREE